MKETANQHEKRCPVCKNEYPEEDNYCGNDGSILEPARAASGNHLSQSCPNVDNGGMTERRTQ